MVKTLKDILREAVEGKSFLVLGKDPHHLRGLEGEMYHVIDVHQGCGG